MSDDDNVIWVIPRKPRAPWWVGPLLLAIVAVGVAIGWSVG